MLAVATTGALASTTAAPGWFAVARAVSATRMAPSNVLDAMPDIAATWEVSGGGVQIPPADCDGADFEQTWQTAAFFDEEGGAKYDAKGGIFNYEFMKDDTRRTPLYYAAIRERLAGLPPQVVLDLGTGAQALLALEAARAGAKKVYAIEAQPSCAQQAREAVSAVQTEIESDCCFDCADVCASSFVRNTLPQQVAAAGFADVIEVIEGISTRVTLPEKVDVLISEVVGSVASEEGLYATISDAHARHVKRPMERASWIPHRCHTIGAACSYALHASLGMPDYNWRRLAGPPRVAAACSSLQLLSEAHVVETIDFTDPVAGAQTLHTPAVTMTIDAERLQRNEQVYARAATPAEEGEEEMDEEERAEAIADAASFAALVSRSFSGVAMWPRLELDPNGKHVVEARGEAGEPRSSSWGCLLPLIGERPMRVNPGDTVTMKMQIDLPQAVETPPQYTVRGRWARAPKPTRRR